MTLDAKSLIAGLPTAPGVYRMLDARGGLLYVGKARNLKKRVTSYFRGRGLTERILTMMRQVADINVTVTHTETEALLLENNLIKSQHPRYNVLLRDDKSYPYIFVSDAQTFPRIGFHRGAKRERGRYFGPYPSATSVRESLGLMQKNLPGAPMRGQFLSQPLAPLFTTSNPALHRALRRADYPRALPRRRAPRAAVSRRPHARRD